MPRMTRDRTIGPPSLRAECHGCEWTSTAPNALGNAAQHHDRTGHPITVNTGRTVTYGNPHAPPPGQLDLNGHATQPIP
jgi:hypothetical protein